MDEKASIVTAAADHDVSELRMAVGTAVARLYRRFRSERLDGELGDSAVAVLMRLQKQGPQSLTALSAHDHVTPASMSQIVNRLTSAGYAVRSSDAEDGRRVLFSATPEGCAVAIAARARRDAWFDARLQALSDEDRAVLAQAAVLLLRIADG